MLNFTMFLLAFTFSVTAFAASIDTKAKSARVYTGKKHVVKCGPDAVGDVLLPIQASSALKNGSTLILMPGNYEGVLQITANKVLITGDDSGKKCDVDLKISGRDCIVRDVWIDDLSSNRNTVVVDAIIARLRTDQERDKKTKIEQYIFNSCLSAIDSGWGSASIRIAMKNCTLVSEWGGEMCPIECNPNIRLTIINSVIYSPSMVFRFPDCTGRAKSKLVLDGCILFGKSGLGKVGWRESSSKKKIALNLKQLKKLASIKLKKGTKMEMPKFMKKTRFSEGGHCRYERMSPLSFILTPKSPGQGKGVDPKTHPILAKALKNENLKILE